MNIKTRKPQFVTIPIEGQEVIYRAVATRIDEWDEIGRPRTLRVVHDDETIRIQGGDQFLIVYMLEDFTKPPTKAKA